MKKALLTLLLIAPLGIFAQVTGTIRGILIDDENDEALPYVTIALTPEGSTAPTSGCSTGEDGSFRLNNIKAGKYTITASFIGYLEENRDVVISAGKNNINLGTTGCCTD